MADPQTDILQASPEIVFFKIRKLAQNLFCAQAVRKKIQYIRDADAHASNTRPASTLLRIDRDSIQQVLHISFPNETAKNFMPIELFMQYKLAYDV